MKAALVAVLIALATTSAAAARPQAQLDVFFLRGEQLAHVERPGGSAADALRQLLAGPTAAEHRLEFRTYVPAGSKVMHLTVADGLATVDMNRVFATSGDPSNRLARLAQLVRTLTGVQGTKRVLLLVGGASSDGLFPGIDTSGPITFRALQTPDHPVKPPPPERLGPPDPKVRKAQQRLVALHYLVPGDVDGRFGPTTSTGVLAFQKWEGLARTGNLDAATTARLATAAIPTTRTEGAAGRRAEILLDRQVALLIQDNHVVRAIAVSTGKPSTPTPPGDYRVYAKIERWWSTPFREWLPWALPFVGGIAFHEFAVVPAYPASHGCVRQAYSVARWTYDFASVGMPVKVISRS
jgi:peptidoglycan hydrolase-like protein with peptidoglycan-binding domain